jgi:muconolactone delta-isomerase
VRLDKEVEKAKSQLKKCKGKYKEMWKAKGETNDSFSYQADENMKKIGAKLQTWHGSDLNGVSARLFEKRCQSLG